jgi:dTDP-glucose 4,6-dehydratase
VELVKKFIKRINLQLSGGFITDQPENYQMARISGKRVFLSGGAGFIGSALASRLIEKNEIVIYDNLRRNSIQNKPFLKHKNLKMVKGDILDAIALKKAVSGCDIIVNLAAVAGIDTVIKSPTTTMKVNMTGAGNMLEAVMSLDKCERFIQFSTSEVFGVYSYKSSENDITHIGCVGEARWTYAVSKLAAEHMAHSYHKEFGLPVVSLRPFNVYGPGQVGEGAIHIFVKKAIKGDKIEIHGDGDQIRSWCYIDDMVEGIMLCLEKKEAVGNVFNIGNPGGTATIYNLAQLVKKVSGSGSDIVFTPKTYADVELRMPNIDKAKRLLGYNPKIGLEEGIRRTVAWYRDK